MCHVYVIVITISIAFGVVVHLPPIDALQAGRFTWLYLHPNIAGSFLASSTVVLLACLLLRRAGNVNMTWPTWCYGLGLAVHVGALIATQSRGALAATAAAMMVVAWSGSRRRSRLDLALLGIALIAIVWIIAGGGIVTYLQRGDSAQQLGTLNSRTEVWSEGFRLFHQRPLLGHGFMSARGAFLQTFGLGGAHNAFVEALVDGGAFGVIWFAAIIVLGMRSAGRLASSRRPDGPVLQGLILACAVNGFTEGGLAQAATVQNIWLYVAVGWAVAAHRWQDEEEAVEQADNLAAAERARSSTPLPALASVSSGRSGRARPVR
jgi:O-antigen ligase